MNPKDIIKQAQDTEMDLEVKKAHLQSAMGTAHFWARAFIKVPTEGTAKFGPFVVRFFMYGIGVCEGKDIRHFIPTGG